MKTHHLKERHLIETLTQGQKNAAPVTTNEVISKVQKAGKKNQFSIKKLKRD